MSSMALSPYDDSMIKVSIKGVRAPNKQPKPLLTGHTCLITGSNSGIGLACAKILPTLGVSHLIMAVRSIEKGETAAILVRKAHPKVKVEVWDLDMLSYSSILTFTQRCSALPHLDIAILNAGVGSSPVCKIHEATGHEETIQVNYLSTALLSILLLPILSRQRSSGAPGRLTIVGSGTALFADFTNRTANPLLPSFDTSYPSAMNRYGTSKLLVLMLVHQLSQVVSADRVIVNAVEPGLTSGTQLHRDWNTLGKLAMSVSKKLMARTPEQAAWSYVDAIAKGKESHGGFIMFWEVCGFPKIMYTDEGRAAMQRLWDETMVELEFAKVRDIVESMGK